MTVRFFLITTAVSVLISWCIWLLVIFWVDPSRSTAVGFFLFFLSLFLAVASSAALSGYGLRRVLQPKNLAPYHVRPALRQGVLLGIFLDLLLFLQLQRILRWWVVIIVILLFVSFEIFFSAYDRSSNRYRATEEERA